MGLSVLQPMGLDKLEDLEKTFVKRIMPTLILLGTADVYPATVSENQPNGTFVTTVTALDQDLKVSCLLFYLPCVPSVRFIVILFLSAITEVLVSSWHQEQCWW